MISEIILYQKMRSSFCIMMLMLDDGDYMLRKSLPENVVLKRPNYGGINIGNSKISRPNLEKKNNKT